jgi:hypothetical protein
MNYTEFRDMIKEKVPPIWSIGVENLRKMYDTISL